MEVLVSALLGRRNLPGVRAAPLACSDRPVSCLMSKVQDVLSGYFAHLYPTSV